MNRPQSSLTRRDNHPRESFPALKDRAKIKRRFATKIVLSPAKAG